MRSPEPGGRMGRFRGWLIGIDVLDEGIELIFKCRPEAGGKGVKSGKKRVTVRDRFRPHFYVIMDREEDAQERVPAGEGPGGRIAQEVKYLIEQHPHVEEVRLERRFTSIANSEWTPARGRKGRAREEVLRVSVDSVREYGKVVRDMFKVRKVRELAETGIPHYFRYVTDRGLWFFREYRIKTERMPARGDCGRPGGKVRNLVSMRESRGKDSGPDMETAAVIRDKGDYEALTGGGASGRFTGSGLRDFLEGQGVDVVFTPGWTIPHGGWLHIDVMRDISNDIYSDDYEWDDGTVSTGSMPARAGFSRPEGKGSMPARAGFSRPEGKGSMLERLLEVGEERLLRVMELSRLTGAGPGTVTRITPGGLNTYLHTRAAREKGFLIPDFKKSMERPKSLRMLYLMDKGGLIFYPEPGVYRDVAKCDFASMYPNIIVRYNISPEVMECSCCRRGRVPASRGGDGGIEVPEAGWRICSRREGIIPRGLRPVLERRLELKGAMKAEQDPARRRELDIRQRALKNILVTSFGYLGFKNFIFSNVECKECVMLWGRHILLRAKGIAEGMGLEVVYGIVDSVFVRGGSREDYEEYARRVSQETGIGLELDRLFRRIAFPAARDSSGIANKYYGFGHDGGFEARGIALRHSDACPLVKGFQGKAVELILAEGGLEGNMRKAGQLLEGCKALVHESARAIMRGEESPIPGEAFVIAKRLRRPLEAYVANAPHVVAARRLGSPPGTGRSPGGRPGNWISYVHSPEGPVPAGQARGIDPDRYSGLLDMAFEELVRGIGREGKEGLRAWPASGEEERPSG